MVRCTTQTTAKLYNVTGNFLCYINVLGEAPIPSPWGRQSSKENWLYRMDAALDTPRFRAGSRGITADTGMLEIGRILSL